ncbi:hypothetical protein NtRootA1_14510 [Arthrobacter sp. NtRootA1]|nr:hypothetical protein NtRootA1_14510 [Arthrobacter sp. NtRootA1]
MAKNPVPEVTKNPSTPTKRYTAPKMVAIKRLGEVRIGPNLPVMAGAFPAVLWNPGRGSQTVIRTMR